MLRLPNKCRCSGTPGDPKKGTTDQLPVYPSNWNTPKAKVNCKWYIKYRFYDDILNLDRQIVIKGMNDFTTLEEKQDAVVDLMENELYEIKKKGFNKITGLYSVTADDEITIDTPFLEALQFSFRKLKCEPETKRDIKSVLKYLSLGIKALKYDRLTLGQITNKHMVFLMEKTGDLKTVDYNTKQEERRKKHKAPLPHQPWSKNTYNAYRAKFGILYSYFSETLKIVDSNIVHSLKREDSTKRIRETMTDEQFTIVNKDLHDNHYSFWRFMVMFYDSTSRETEMMKVRKPDVELSRQRFKITVKKGSGGWEEQWRIISNDVLHLWEEQYSKAGPNQFLFSYSLEPGDIAISPRQITRRWLRHVKHPLSVTADFYSLKHSHVTEMMEFLIAEREALKEVAERAGHTTTKMVKTVYDVKQAERQNKMVIKMPNKFAKGQITSVKEV